MPKIINVKGDIIPNDNKWLYDWFGWDSTCPNDVISVLREVNGAEDIVIEIGSGGGSVFAAHEIYTALSNYQGNIEAHVVSIAGSAASEILMAVKSKISPVASVMIHNCSSYASGDYREMDSASNMLKTINQSIRNAYKAKTGLSDEELSKYMDDTTWMDAEQAVKLGFVDEIMELNNDANNTITNKAIPTLYNSTGLIIDQDKIKSLKTMISQEQIASLQAILNQTVNQDNKPMNQKNTNESDSKAFINIKDNNKGGKTVMTLQEAISANPELQNEVDAIKVTARQEGEVAERNRMKEIDSISAAIPATMVNDAKFTNPCSAQELSLKFIQDSANKGKDYLQNAIDDSKKSKVDDIKPDPTAEINEKPDDNDDKLADLAAKAANKNRKGGK